MMIVMILLMILPLIALPVFWWLPLSQAIPVYLVCLLFSVGMYWLMHRTMKTRVAIGPESLAGKEARIVSKTGSRNGAPYLVKINGEIWSAFSLEVLDLDDTVTIVAIQGNKLSVKSQREKSPSSRSI